MKFILALFLVFSFLLVGSLSCARKDLGDYWTNVMNDQPMPEAIKNLIQVPQASSNEAGKAHFLKDFDVKPNVILYHTHVKKQKQNAADYEPAVSRNRKSFFEQAAGNNN